MRKVVRLLLVAAMLSLPVSGFALTVSTEEIGNGAVTTPKIADGAVTSVKIGAGAVTNGKIAAGAVANGNIADGAVTDAKITGPISGTKLGAHSHAATDLTGTISTGQLAIGTSTGTVAAGDHSHDSQYQKKYANVIVVAKSGGDFTSLSDAINSIGDASETNGYLVKVMPGTYDLANGFLYMKSYVDIEGAGQNVTVLNGALAGANFCELRNLTVKRTAMPGDTYITGVFLDYVSPKLTDVKIVVTGTGPYDATGVEIVSSKADFNNVTIEVRADRLGIGMYANNAQPIMNNVSMDVTATSYTKGISSACDGYGDVAERTFMNNVRIYAHGAAVSNFGIYQSRNGNGYICKDTLMTNSYVETKGTPNDNGGIFVESGSFYVMNTIIDASWIPMNNVSNCVNVVNASLQPLACN